MKLRELTLSTVLDIFEKEMFSTERDFEIANGLEFELFSLDEDNIYTLQFDRDENTYSICQAQLEPNGGEYMEEVYLETYPMDLYNREFLVSRLLKYIVEMIENQTKGGM